MVLQQFDNYEIMQGRGRDMTASTPGQYRTTPLELFPIPVAALRAEAVTSFDLYLPSQGSRPPVLYRGSNVVFLEKDRLRLADHGVTELLIPRDQSAAYQNYAERHLGALLGDESIPLSSRCKVMYATTQALVQSIFDDPRSGTVMPRTAAVVKDTMEFMTREKHALPQLMSVMSFDYYTYTHSVNVFTFSVMLAARLGHGGQELHRFGQGALLHDLGKTRIDTAILNCRGRLSDEQWAIMKEHPVWGHDMLRDLGVTDEIILDVTRHHHEKLNGTGYPDGLRGEQITPWARMTTVADIFDALTTQRSYKGAIRSFEALLFMREHMKDDLDPECFKEFVGLLGA
jgi:putative nucleotidyltransferase with HDIG domain